MMNKKLLKKHINSHLEHKKQNVEKYIEDKRKRQEMIDYYQTFTSDKLNSMDRELAYQYFSKLWAMLIWGNKKYKVDKMIEDNGLDNIKRNLIELLWSKKSIEKRWDNFRKTIKGMGPAMISEILCKTHPKDFLLWNRRALIGFNYLGVKKLPRYDYQLTGKVYAEMCKVGKELAKELQESVSEEIDFLSLDYFIWDELQVEEVISKKLKSNDENDNNEKIEKVETGLDKEKEKVFIHNDVRDKLRDIGEWLGFNANVEQKVSTGARVDVVWESTIGNMGRIIYVFEVQTKGSIDSLLVNLQKALNNPAVQGVVAVSDKKQNEKIKAHSQGLTPLREKLKYWDYKEVLQIHEYLEYTNEKINNLGLVPEGF